MSDTLIKGVIICCIYMTVRYIESRFITKEPIKLKTLVQNTLMVYISYITGMFVYEQLEPIKKLTKAPSVFTAEPGF
jgi:hypothetical protein